MNELLLNNKYSLHYPNFQVPENSLEEIGKDKEGIQNSYSLFYKATNNIGQEILILGINHYLDVSTFPHEVIDKFVDNKVLIHETSYAEIVDSVENNRIEYFKFKEKLSLQLLKGNWNHFEIILKAMKIDDFKIQKYKLLFQNKQNEFIELIENNWLSQFPEETRIQIKKLAEKFNINLDHLHPTFVLGLLNYENSINSIELESVEKFLIRNFADQNKQRIELDNTDIVNQVLNYDFIQDLKYFTLKDIVDESQNLRHWNAQEFKKQALESYQKMSEDSRLWDVCCMIETPEEDLIATYRNKIWEITIKHSLTLHQSFSLLVGYDHLKGCNGLLKFLLDQNFTIEQILL